MSPWLFFVKNEKRRHSPQRTPFDYAQGSGCTKGTKENKSFNHRGHRGSQSKCVHHNGHKGCTKDTKENKENKSFNLRGHRGSKGKLDNCHDREQRRPRGIHGAGDRRGGEARARGVGVKSRRAVISIV